MKLNEFGDGPRWYDACAGLMLYGICKNTECEAYN